MPIHDPIKRFLLMLATSTAAAGVLLACAIVLVDPYGLFGTGLFPAVVLTNRSQKISALSKMQPPPEVLIFGSSRMFRADPEQLAQLTGLRAYNASVSYARPEEHLALLRVLLEDLHVKPKLIIVGINVGEFNHDPMDVQTITNRQLRTKLPISRLTLLRTILAIFKERVNPGMVRDLATAVFFRFAAAPPEQVRFKNNGMQEPGLDEDRTARVLASIPSTVTFYQNGDGLSAERIAFFREFVARADAAGVPVQAVILPIAPAAQADIGSQSPYNQLLDEMRTFFGDLHHQTPNFTFTDGTDITSYRADPGDFADATHPKERLLHNLIEFSLKDTGLSATPL